MTGQRNSRSGAAFFDLDRTLMAGSSAFAFARASYETGLVSRRQLAGDAWANLRFRLEGSTDAGTDALRARIAESLRGTRVRDLERLGGRVLMHVLPRVYPRMLEVAYEHQDAGRPIYICTAAAHEMAELLAYVLRFDGGIGSRSEVAHGHYTGHPAGPFTYREGKAEAIRALALAEDLDLEQSWAYSDSESDLPMLEAVGHPVAVNPDLPLREIAEQRGWEVMTFETLGRRIRVAGAALGAVALGGAGAAVATRRRSRRLSFRSWPPRNAR